MMPQLMSSHRCLHCSAHSCPHKRSKPSSPVCSQLSTQALTVMRSSYPFPVGGERSGVAARVEVVQSLWGVERQIYTRR